MPLGKPTVDRVARNTNTHDIVETTKRRVLKHRNYSLIATTAAIHVNTVARLIRGENISIHILSAIENALNHLEKSNDR